MRSIARRVADLLCVAVGALSACATDRPPDDPIGGNIRVPDSVQANAGLDSAVTDASSADLQATMPDADDGAADVPDDATRADAALALPDTAILQDVALPDAAKADIAADVASKDAPAEVAVPGVDAKDGAATDAVLKDSATDAKVADAAPDKVSSPDMVQDKVAPPPDVAEDKVAPPPDVVEDKVAPPPDVAEDKVAPPPDVAEDKVAPPPDVAEDKVAPPDVAEDKVAPPPDVVEDKVAPLPDVVEDKVAPPPDVVEDKVAPLPDVAEDKVAPPPDVAEDKIAPLPDVAEDKVAPPPDVVEDKVAPLPDVCSPKPEICDGKDNDCNGKTDEQPASSLCDDGDPCTAGEACVGGLCSAGTAISCDDANVCTNDACIAGTGCTHQPNALVCDADGSLCTSGDHCSGAACVAGAVANCEDGNACTTDSCIALSGCAHAASQGACSDGDACSPVDQCSAGTCAAGAQISCGDTNPCTLDSCSAGVCQHGAISGCVTRMQMAFGGAYADSIAVMRATPDGGFVLGGSTDSFGQGSGDMLLIKTDACGNREWMRSFGGEGKDKGHGLALTPDGGYILVGESSSDDASGNAYVVKTDAQGQREWSVTHGGNSYEWAESVTVTSDGGYVISAKTYSFGPNTPMWHNAMIFKLDATGKLLWSRVFGAENGSMDPVVIQEVKKVGGQWDGLLMVGGSEGFGQGKDDVWLMKLTANGSHEWSVVHGSSGDENAFRFLQTPDMGYVIVSDTNGFSSSAASALILKTDVSGKLLWAKRYGLDGKTEPHDLIARADGFVIAGFTLAATAGGVDAFLMSVGQDGAVQWMRTYGGALDDRGFAMAAAADGGVALAGDTMSNGAGGYDGWLVKTAADGSTPCGSKLLTTGAPQAVAVTPVTLSFTPQLLDAGTLGADTTTQGTIEDVTAGTTICSCQ